MRRITMKLKTIVISTFVLSLTAASAQASVVKRFTDREICKAGLAMALNKSPQLINAVGVTGANIFLAEKSRNRDDWEYRCEVNKETIQLDARNNKRKDVLIDGIITYNINKSKKVIEVKKKRKGTGINRKIYRLNELN